VSSGIVGRVALLVAVGFVLLSAWALGLLETLTDPKETAALLRSMGVWGYVLYLASFALLSPFFVPGIAFVVPAAMVWPLWISVPLSLVGATGAGSVGFGFARFLGNDWAAQRIPERLRRWDDALVSRPIRTTILIRLIFFLFPPAHWALGLSRIPYGAFALGTFLGYIPFIVAMSVIGNGLMQWIESQNETAWIGIAIGLAVLAAARWLNKRRRQGGEATSNAESGEAP
jgi:uncharacterized membrane protein YdjX (TVP38/TMEM64 family)